ncbi:MAG: aminopeptidase [Desulfobacterota bacterium]|nr:aminopeptidase [Thermodesulfobacteriota bacterium]MDW8002008.1 aminopeptidase [Deltaproteobacteria bacterium]
MVRESGWKRKSKEEYAEIFQFAETYKRFLDEAKTERETVTYISEVLKKSGFSEDPRSDKVLKVFREKSVFAFIKGVEPLTSGMNIIVSHIDTPRLDFKQNPLFEEVGLALFRTHYYGGIKKYQWVAIPLAIHGVVVKADGRKIRLRIGEEENDPVFVIDDLLPHLSRKTLDEKKLSEAPEAEKLTVLCGNIPLVGVEREAVKAGVLEILKNTYGIGEEDFISADIEVVPAFKARDVGLDRSMIGAYGQDDRVCAYAMLQALVGLDRPKRPCLAIFTDKEEIGSEGDTAIKSTFLFMMLYEIMESMGIKPDDPTIKKALFSSRAISADVNGAVNPMYQDVHEKQNACYLGYGVCIEKFTGHGGKIGASEAHAEYVAEIRRIFDAHGIVWQTGELGKVDEGGGGTVAKYLAAYGMNIIDCGTPVLTMHSPFEITSKLDVYETFRAYKAFYES